MANYRISKKAEDDLRRIWLHGLEKYGEVQADVYFFKFFARFEQLSNQPFLAPEVDEIRQGYRRAVCGIDNIYYRIDGDDIEIMRILGRQSNN
ncbi:type II toxin-antitoxin system RelE/ParE family toxin [Catenovulum sp. SX2]|uniref:type II toxin-antitoxin system RelE/ParE family toxin n=1 Tax=Catenovulum sp. SX2 TaxID=3398614 RepID=UPI003F8762B2